MGQQIPHKAVGENPKIKHITRGHYSEITNLWIVKYSLKIKNNQRFYLKFLKYDIKV